MISMLQDFGVKVTKEMWGDAQATLGIINRKGLKKTRHIQIGLPWVQQVAIEQRLKYGKVLGKMNPTDLCTKYLDWHTIEQHLHKLKSEFADRRIAETPKLQHVVFECFGFLLDTFDGILNAPIAFRFAHRIV